MNRAAASNSSIADSTPAVIAVVLSEAVQLARSCHPHGTTVFTTTYMNTTTATMHVAYIHTCVHQAAYKVKQGSRRHQTSPPVLPSGQSI